MTNDRMSNVCGLRAAVVFVSATLLAGCSQRPDAGREEVVFWHFWGGRDRPIVDGIVEEFNASQNHYLVRAVAMPGANLDLKFFLSIAGGDPPDLLNHDDPVVADWAHRGVLTPLAELATEEELQHLTGWLFPAARKLGTYDGRFFALCNGLDIRALYCNKTLLAEHGLGLPATLKELDHIAETIAPSTKAGNRKRMGYLPHPDRIWAWGIVFGGQFAKPEAKGVDQIITADAPEIVAALSWMASYSRRYGPSSVAAFRSGEQALTGANFPLLAERRYAVVMDGQWRVRDIAEAQAAGALDEFAVVAPPHPTGGRSDAGRVNGNLFVVPRQARCQEGAWEFMKFWAGFDGNEAVAAEACAAGGWIPVSQHVVDQPAYQQAVTNQPLLGEFVRLAASPHQVPVPALPVTSLYYLRVKRAAQNVLYRGAEPKAALQQAAREVRERLQEVFDER